MASKITLILLICDLVPGLSIKSARFEDLIQTEVSDFSVKFFRYRSTTSQCGRAGWLLSVRLSEELNREVHPLRKILRLITLRLIAPYCQIN